MALYNKRTTQHHKVIDDPYASEEMERVLPQFKMPKSESDPRDTYYAVLDELMLDGNARQNLATFCTTWMEPEVRQLMAASINKNMIDKDEYPQSAEIEQRCIDILADLWNSPEAGTTIGCSTTGSSEAAMLGGMALKWKWRNKRIADGKPTNKPNLITGPVQICWPKFCRYWDVELREIPLSKDNLMMTPEEVLARCDENTIGIVPTLGVTFTGQYEPVKAISDALDKLQAETGLNIPIHVDAASGGFLAPFVLPDLEWDFRLPRVKSINASGHKFGMAPLGVGWALWRTQEDLPEDLIFNVNYLGGHMPTFALNFSRPAGEIISQYYLFLRLGFEGYKKIQQDLYNTAQYLSESIAQMDYFEMVHNGSENGIPAVSWTLKPNIEAPFSLFDLADSLRTRGWLVPAYSMPPNCTDMVIQRILVRHGFSRDMADLLLVDIKRMINRFKRHPVCSNLTESETAGHDHSGR